MHVVARKHLWHICEQKKCTRRSFTRRVVAHHVAAKGEPLQTGASVERHEARSTFQKWKELFFANERHPNQESWSRSAYHASPFPWSELRRCSHSVFFCKVVFGQGVWGLFLVASVRLCAKSSHLRRRFPPTQSPPRNALSVLRFLFRLLFLLTHSPRVVSTIICGLNMDTIDLNMVKSVCVCARLLCYAHTAFWPKVLLNNRHSCTPTSTHTCGTQRLGTHGLQNQTKIAHHCGHDGFVRMANL